MIDNKGKGGKNCLRKKPREKVKPNVVKIYKYPMGLSHSTLNSLLLPERERKGNNFKHEKQTVNFQAIVRKLD